MIQDVLRGGFNLKSPGSLRSLGIFICQLSKASFARRQIKNPAQCAGLFTRAQDWIRTSTPFPALPPQGSASTSFATWARGLQINQKTVVGKD